MTSQSRFDVVIVGGGPAGMSAANWCCELGLSSVLIESKSQLGGQLNSIHGPISNYLGITAGNGKELLQKFSNTLSDQLVRMVETEVSSIDPLAKSVRVGEQDIGFGCVIIATGVRRRRLWVNGESELRGRGILESGVLDKKSVEGKHVVIVGGGDAAAENAVILSSVAERVTVVHRRDHMTARPEFLDEIGKRDNIRILVSSEVRRIRGDSWVSAVDVADSTGVVKTVDAGAVLIRIGVEPNSELLLGLVELDSKGYAIVDSVGRTSVGRVFAIGDVAAPLSPTISTAAGMGATAAKAAYTFIKLEEIGV